jgi:hypothetical protein
MIAKNSKKIKEFLNFVKSQKEVGFIITENDKDLKEFEKELTLSSFIKNGNIVELGESLKKSGKNFIVLKNEDLKSVYDFLIQYPTGQIEIFDSKLMKSEVIIPNYAKSTVVLLTTKKYLSKIEKEGYDLLSHAGLTCQS